MKFSHTVFSSIFFFIFPPSVSKNISHIFPSGLSATVRHLSVCVARMAPVSKGDVRTPDTLKGPVRNCSSPQLLHFCLYHHPNTLSSPSVLSPYQWTQPSILWSQATAFPGIGPASSGTDSSPQAEHLACWKTEIRNRSKKTVRVSSNDVSILT